jgi:hypothetical protein
MTYPFFKVYRILLNWDMYRYLLSNAATSIR